MASPQTWKPYNGKALEFRWKENIFVEFIQKIESESHKQIL